MAAEWWWFLVLNAIVAVIAVLSKGVGPSSPRGGGFTRRASSAALQRLRSSLFSFPSSSGFQFHFHTAAPAPLPQQPEAAAPSVVASRETEEPAAVAPPAKPAAPSKIKPATRVHSLAPPVPAAASVPAATAEEEEGDPDDPNAISMDEAYARIVAARKSEMEEGGEARRSDDVDAKAEEFIQGFKEDLRQQRLNSIFNYTQMLKKRAFGDGRR